jgi:hypothetical protein
MALSAVGMTVMPSMMVVIMMTMAPTSASVFLVSLKHSDLFLPIL